LTINDQDIRASFSIQNSRLIEKPSFVDFLTNGWVLNLNCAIDFTSSNGEVSDPKSLHYQNPNGYYNDYENAIL